MRKMFLVLAIPLMMAGCGVAGYLPLLERGNTVKYFTRMVGGEPVQDRMRRMEMVAFVDPSRHNPLNALDYILEDSGTLFFDHVVLGGAYVRRGGPHGFYLYLSGDLKNLLAARRDYVMPLQGQGIRVLLRIESGGADVSMGQWNEDQMRAIARTALELMDLFGLDGMEFMDNSTAEAHPYIGDFDYVEDAHLWGNAEEWLVEQWTNGALEFNNVFHTIRHLDRGRRLHGNLITFLREVNFGRWMPYRVHSTDGWAEFAVSDHQITFSFAADPGLFYGRGGGGDMRSAQRDRYDTDHLHGDSFGGWSWMPESRFGPLVIDLDGGPGRNVFFQIADADGFDPEDMDAYTGPGFFEIAAFMNGPHQAIYFDGLMSIDEARGDEFYRWLHFDPDIPEFDWTFDGMSGWGNREYFPLPLVFDWISRMLFLEGVVVREGGGNHARTW